MSTNRKDLTIAETLEEFTKKKTWDDFFNRTPCVKPSYLWGFACGSLMTAHKLRLYKGRLNLALNYGFFTFLSVSSIFFLNCAYEVNSKHEMIQKAFTKQKIQHINEK
mmetsp:Transcript_14952/g.16184  ORF Transcript_14952/g.16184 Transcript_14952/m.16184 type:complete len:108 (+) Transcript_14952:52-375(+)